MIKRNRTQKEANMLYSAHFSFDEIGVDQEPRHGYFSCLVQADNPSEALKKIKNRILYIRNETKDEVFSKILAIYVEDIIEMEKFPEDAVITRFQSSEGPFPKSKSCFLPVSETDKLKSYQWVPDEGEANRDKEGYKEDEPFLKF